MLTDMLEEEEFEMKEDEPWYDKQDLEHDLQLAAELGKGLLERNRELKQGLQQMYATNQEQLQEIEYLTKQVELVRQTNNQHVKMYEQLDMSSRELEQSNRLLLQNNKAAEQKIQRLTDTVSLLQAQVEELQHHVEDLKLSPHRETLQRPPAPRSTHSVSCLQLHNALRFDEAPDEPSDNLDSSSLSWEEEEQASLRRSLHALQKQLATERALRDEAEREAKLLAAEMSALEQQLSQLEGCQVRLSELEHEAEELRQLWKSESSSRSSRPDIIHDLLPDSIFLNVEENNEAGEAAAVKSPFVLRRWGSEQLLKAVQKTPPDGQHNKIPDHECSCVRRAEVVKYRGISLLNEVDAQYSALQVKYDELLRRSRQGEEEEEEDEPDGQIHKSVQTNTSSLTVTDVEDFHQPEYKELFRKIFSHIQKTKEDLGRNRSTRSSGDKLPPLH